MLNKMTHEIRHSMSYVTSVSQMWKDLQDKFSSIDGHKIYQLQRDLHSLEQDDKSVEIYFHNLKGYWDEYRALKPLVEYIYGAHQVLEARESRRKLLRFLLGLHDSFSNARGQILMMNPYLM